jgi:hypothetical protein
MLALTTAQMSVCLSVDYWVKTRAISTDKTRDFSMVD